MGLGVFKDQVSVMHPGDIPLGADIPSCPEFRQQGGGKRYMAVGQVLPNNSLDPWAKK